MFCRFVFIYLSEIVRELASGRSSAMYCGVLSEILAGEGTMDFTSFNERYTSRLNYAARIGDLDDLKKLLAHPVCDVNYCDNRGWTALHEAAAHDHIDAMELLLKHKSCRPTLRSHDGKSALFVAIVANSSMRTIDRLLKVDELSYLPTNEEVSPLHVAVLKGRIDVMEALLSAGAKINNRDFDGDTALHEAAHSGNLEAVTLLLHAGCKPHQKNEKLYTPLHLACMRNVDCVAEILKFTTDLDCRTETGDTPLSLAASHGSLRAVQLLLKHGASPNVLARDNKVALYQSLDSNDPQIFKLLLERTDRFSINFHMVVDMCRLDLFQASNFEVLLHSDLGTQFFLEHPEPRNYRQIKKTPVHPPLAPFLSIADYLYNSHRTRFEGLLMLFLLRGVPVNATFPAECPPLCFLQLYAKEACGKELIRILVGHGANVDYRSDPNSLLPDAIAFCLEENHLLLPSLLEHSLSTDFEELLFKNPITRTPEFLCVKCHTRNTSQWLNKARGCKTLEVLSICNVCGDRIKGMQKDPMQLDIRSLWPAFVPRVGALGHLKHLTRRIIRKQLHVAGKPAVASARIESLVDQLPLPRSLRDYIQFKV